MRAAPIVIPLLVFAGCGSLKETHNKFIEGGRIAHDTVAPQITSSDLQLCAGKISEVKGTFGNTVFQLAGPVKPDPRLTCFAYYKLLQPAAPTAYVSAPAKLMSGWGGIGLKADDRLYWCSFELQNGKVTLSKFGVGLGASGLESENDFDKGLMRGGCPKAVESTTPERNDRAPA